MRIRVPLAVLFSFVGLALASTARPTPLLFHSSWNYMLGESEMALTDGGTWDFATLDPDQMEVVASGVMGNNALRVKIRDEGDPHVDELLGTGPNALTPHWYWRLYVMVKDNCPTNNLHGIQTPAPFSEHTYVGVRDNPSSAGPGFWTAYTDIGTDLGGVQFIGPPDVLQNDRWYRVEGHWTFERPGKKPSGVTVEVRYYDDNDVLVLTEADFEEGSPAALPLSEWNTLGLLMANGAVDSWFMGNNGPATQMGACDIYDISSFGTSRFGWLGPARPDTDGDGVADVDDNCVDVANTDQCDTDVDGYGNRCDCDLDGSGLCQIGDFALFAGDFGEPGHPFSKADMDCDGIVQTSDLGVLGAGFGAPSGPTGLACAGTQPCPPGLDTDQDTLDDIVDNCLVVENTDQCDTNQDGYGNFCDCDLDDNGTCQVEDFWILYGALGGPGHPTSAADLNCDGLVDSLDQDRFSSQWGSVPLSGFPCAGTVPCPVP